MSPSQPSPAAALARRLLGFSTLPFLASVLPLVALPFMSRAASTDDWSALNIGLGVGTFAGAIGLVGWNILGTPLVAMADSDTARRGLYGRSFYIRSAVVLLASILSAVVASLISPASSWPVAAAFAVAGALNGIGLSWYAVGVSSPRIALWYEVVPRAAATAAAIGVVVLTQDVLWYGILLSLSIIIGTVAFHRRVLGRFWPAWPGMLRLRSDIGDMKAAWGVESIGSLYQNAPVPVAGLIAAPVEVAAYASSDRIYRYGTLGVAAAGNALQGWVLETTDVRSRRSRNLAAFAVMAVIAAIGWVVLAVFGPFLSGLLFGADKQGDPAAFHFLGIAFISVTMATPLIRNILIPARRDGFVLAVNMVSAIVGVALMVVLGSWLGTTGVAIGFAVSETATLIGCVFLATRVGLAPQQRGSSTDRKKER
ncbi:lipopolysaccharide biosynthesis protein [Microbacterium sp.]|uniref:lipopolysaccharide biosynthesis protein n=1 Tax=Microbacterium sp. TaxID=51671 RepID=UPI002FDF626C